MKVCLTYNNRIKLKQSETLAEKIPKPQSTETETEKKTFWNQKLNTTSSKTVSHTHSLSVRVCVRRGRAEAKGK